MAQADWMSIPDLMACKRLLCIQPHPDDNEIGAGGTIARLVKLGCTVTFLTVTDGGIGSRDPLVPPDALAAIRRAEIREAARILGVAGTLEFGYPDAAFLPEKELCQKIVGVIRDIKPDFVMTVDPWLPYETHPDHRAVGMAAAAACFMTVFPHFPSWGGVLPAPAWEVQGIALYHTAYPNTFINVDEAWDIKLAAIRASASQCDRSWWEAFEGYLDRKSRRLAEGKGYSRAEAFKVLRRLQTHINVDAINM